MPRQCFNPACGALITECNGFAVARDVLQFLDGSIPAEKVRELCGRCVLVFVPGSNEWVGLLENAPR